MFFGLLSHSPDPLLLLFFWLGARVRPRPLTRARVGGGLWTLDPRWGVVFFLCARARAAPTRVGGGWCRPGTPHSHKGWGAWGGLEVGGLKKYMYSGILLVPVKRNGVMRIVSEGFAGAVCS